MALLSVAYGFGRRSLDVFSAPKLAVDARRLTRGELYKACVLQLLTLNH